MPPSLPVEVRILLWSLRFCAPLTLVRCIIRQGSDLNRLSVAGVSLRACCRCDFTTKLNSRWVPMFNYVADLPQHGGYGADTICRSLMDICQCNRAQSLFLQMVAWNLNIPCRRTSNDPVTIPTVGASVLQYLPRTNASYNLSCHVK